MEQFSDRQEAMEKNCRALRQEDFSSEENRFPRRAKGGDDEELRGGDQGARWGKLNEKWDTAKGRILDWASGIWKAHNISVGNSTRNRATDALGKEEGTRGVRRTEEEKS